MFKRHRGVGFGALATAGALLLSAGCAGAGGSTSSSQKTVDIALFTPLTGSNADAGGFNKNAIEMAVDDVNAAGGIHALNGAKLRLVVADSTSDATTAVSAAQHLLSNKNIAGVVGLNISPLILATQPLFERSHVPFIVAGSSDQITKQGAKYTFQLSPRASQYAKAEVEFVSHLKQAGGIPGDRVAIAYVNSEYGQTVGSTLKKLIPAAGLSLVSTQPFQPDLNDASALVTSIRSSHADVLFPVAYTKDAQLIFTTLASMHVDPLLVAGGGGFIWPAFKKSLGDRVNGLTSAAQWNWSDKNVASDPKLAEIPQRYQQRFGTYMPEPAGLAYAEVWTLAAAVEQAKSTKPEAVAKALHSIDIKSGPATIVQPGEVKFDDAGADPLAFPVIVQWQNGAPQTVYPASEANVSLQSPGKS